MLCLQLYLRARKKRTLGAIKKTMKKVKVIIKTSISYKWGLGI